MSNFIPKPKISTINLKLYNDNYNFNNKKKIIKQILLKLSSLSNFFQNKLN